MAQTGRRAEARQSCTHSGDPMACRIAVAGPGAGLGSLSRAVMQGSCRSVGPRRPNRVGMGIAFPDWRREVGSACLVETGR